MNRKYFFVAVILLSLLVIGLQLVFAVEPLPTSVSIDIKPGSDDNIINLGTNGVIPVAILSSETFDATDVDPALVSIAGMDVAVRGKSDKYSAHPEDVNGDGLLDLVCQMDTYNLVPDELQYGTAELIGQTYSGDLIKGSDSVTIVPPEEPPV